MSTQHLDLMMPSESTTLYFLGTVDKTENKSYMPYKEKKKH